MPALLLTAQTPAKAAPCPVDRRGVHPEQAKHGLNPSTPLLQRVGQPSADALSSYKDAGHTEARAHPLTPVERARLELALSKLPSLHRQILRDHLRSISFIDVSGGGGSGLTSFVGEGDFPIFDFTFRAGILEETLSEFLTEKERALFRDDRSGMSVRIDAPGSALDYVLLHEASHVVDQSLRLTSTLDQRFTAGIWTGGRALAAGWATSPFASTPFRRAPQQSVGNAPILYRSLSASPFVSLYSTAAAAEDFAELVAWQQLSAQHQTPYEIVVRDGDGRLLHRFKPTEQPRVRARLNAVAELLASCSSKQAAKDS